MEPNNQYLCIVPKAKPGPRVLLPFEADQDPMLSIILSKAALLADDEKISDKTILSQIHSSDSSLTFNLESQFVPELPNRSGAHNSEHVTGFAGQEIDDSGSYYRSFPKLVRLPDELRENPYLKELTLFDCGFKEMPELIGSLPNLEYLCIRGNPIQWLPEELGQCSSLRELILRENKIVELPLSLDDLENLETFECVDNKIKELPRFEKMQNLKVLTVYEKKVDAFPTLNNAKLETLALRLGKIGEQPVLNPCPI